ncbi:MAG: DegT/DnrJ/EryC1/StrS family aminotransferase, partial [Promethearchaeota archaeon]
TNDGRVYEMARSYKSHCARVIGTSTKYLSLSDDLASKALADHRHWFQDFDDCGYNFRMADMAAAVGLVQLERLDSLNEIRMSIAAEFGKNLEEIKGIKPLDVIPGVKHVYHLYPILLDEEILGISRNEFVFELRMKHGVKAGIHYMPLVQTTAFKKRGHVESECPISVKTWKSLVTLPIHPRMTAEHVRYLFDAIKSTLGS